MTKPCIVCGSKEVNSLVSMEQIPVHCNILWHTRKEAISAPIGKIHLAVCTNCGHIFNLEFNPALTGYSAAYDNSLHFSPTFQHYAQTLAKRLVEEYDLREKEIIEIGSGQGEFLGLLCDYGNNRGIGFDPSFIPDSNSGSPSGNFEIIPEYYSENTLNYTGDLFCARHLLEHIDQPSNFLEIMAKAIRKRAGALLYIEVPNAMYTFKDLSIWDIIYEHPSFFTANSLRYVLQLNGFVIIDMDTTFGDQFLFSVSKLNGESTEKNVNRGSNVDELLSHLKTFQNMFDTVVHHWNETLQVQQTKKTKLVVWGAGSKGVTFLNVFKQQHALEYVVDINPRKWGKFIPGSGQQVVPPDFLTEYKPDLILLMNPIYEDEVRTMVEDLQVTTNLSVVR